MVVGTQVGAYRVLQQIGEGGMGSVWLAEHAMLGRRAAIKLLHPMFTARQDIVTRFFNEARAATAIQDPGIVQIFDFGYHADGAAYIAMEMLEGEPLDKRLHRLGRLAIPDALRILRQVASSLGVAHARGIVHRDLKPENVFLVHDPEVVGGERAKILDFGIAKLTGDQNIKTNTSAVMGTPSYMSPEQCRGAGQVDQRSDIYALGCMLFALLTGAPPFDAEGVGEIIAMHLREPAPALSSRIPGVPPELDALVLRCMAKDPAQRYASGTELAAALGALLGSVSNVNMPVASATAPQLPRGPVGSATTLSSATGVASGTASVGPVRRSRGVWIAAAAVLLAGGGIAAVAMSQGNDAPVAQISASTSAVTPSAVTPPAAPTAVTAPAAPTPAPDPSILVARHMKQVFASFQAWSQDHAGAPCPSSSMLGQPVLDPWGHPIELTCTDQPANQIIGALSAGPDGALGTPDDIGSWQLGRDVTDLVHGARWVEAARPATAAPGKPARPVKRSGSQRRPTAPATDEDGIPTER